MNCRFSHIAVRTGRHGFILDNETGKRYPESKYAVDHKPVHVKCAIRRIPGSDKRDYSTKNTRTRT
ncbi:MAG: hypothetical protein ACYCQJ_11575 [Nitrososphaerales archaeon]